MSLKNYHIDTLFLIKYNITLSPQEFLIGLNRSFISPKSIIDYAIDKLLVLESGDVLFDIALLDKNEHNQVRDILEKDLKNISKHIDYISYEYEILQKWLYLLLKWLYDNKDHFKDPLQIIEELYADFDYPEEIESLIRYMPISSSDIAYDSENREIKGIDRIINNWLIFLQEGDKKFLCSSFL